MLDTPPRVEIPRSCSPEAGFGAQSPYPALHPAGSRVDWVEMNPPGSEGQPFQRRRGARDGRGIGLAGEIADCGEVAAAFPPTHPGITTLGRLDHPGRPVTGTRLDVAPEAYWWDFVDAAAADGEDQRTIAASAGPNGSTVPGSFPASERAPRPASCRRRSAGSAPTVPVAERVTIDTGSARRFCRFARALHLPALRHILTGPYTPGSMDRHPPRGHVEPPVTPAKGERPTRSHG